MKTGVTYRNTMLADLIANYNTGFIDIYSGTRPADSDTGLAGNTLLCSLTFAATAFQAPSGGNSTGNAIGNGTCGNNGTGTFARLFKADHTTAVSDISVSTSGAELNLSTVALTVGLVVSITSSQMQFPVGT